MKKIIIPIYIIFLISSCGSKLDETSAKQKELELKAKELELKEKELEQKKSEENPNKDEVVDEKKTSELSNNSSNPTPQPRKKTEDDLRQELYNKECSKALKYLSLDYSLNYKVFSGKDEIKGKVYNYATMAGYKDILLEVKFKSEAGYLLKTDYFGIYDNVFSGNSIPFSFKTYSPQGTKIIDVSIYEAKCL